MYQVCEYNDVREGDRLVFGGRMYLVVGVLGDGEIMVRDGVFGVERMVEWKIVGKYGMVVRRGGVMRVVDKVMAMFL